MFLQNIGELKYSHPKTKLVNKDEALSLRGFSYLVLHMLLYYHKALSNTRELVHTWRLYSRYVHWDQHTSLQVAFR